MSAPDWTTVLGRLLTQRALRSQLRRDPEACGDALGLESAERVMLRELDVDQLEAQAGTLLGKRYREVAAQLPRTVALLGERAWPLFREYAADQWPTGHDRHQIDAIAYAEFVASRASADVDGRELAIAQFRLRRDVFALRWVRLFDDAARLRRALLVLRRRPGGHVSVWWL